MVGFRTQLKTVIMVGLFTSFFGLQVNHAAWADDNNLTWAQLNDEQRKVLNPLSSEWDTLRPWQREKMLDIARDYPKMHPEKQALVQKRLSNWSRMTPYERENARKRHQQFQSLSPEKKAELRKKWLEYDKLPETQREKLRMESPETYTDADLN
jgi:hypothetical protein